MTVQRSTKSILIVDDYRTMLKIVRSLLKELGFDRIDEASDGAAALEKLRKGAFDLILADWSMEPMSGLDLLREVRNDQKLKRTPFIMVTAESKTDAVIAAQKAGVSGYIVKPFNASTLKVRLASVLGEF